MHRGFRFSATVLAAALLASAASPVLAQSNVVAPPPPPREGTVGPEQLRDFSLGNSNRQSEQPPADQSPAAEAAPSVAPPQSNPPASAGARPAPSATPPIRLPQLGSERAEPSTRPAASQPQTPETPGSDVTLGLPPPTPVEPSTFDFNAPGLSGSTPSADVARAPVTADDQSMPLWPWLLAFAAVIGAGLFLWSRRRAAPSHKLDGSSLAFAGGVPVEGPRPAPRARPASPPQRAAPAPVPARAPQPQPPQPVPAPAPAPAPSHPKGVGIVSSRLRPWLDVDVAVTGAVLTEEELQLQLQLLVSNSGSTPARQVGLEVVALNAGPEQDKELATYFARPDPDPRAADMIAPLDQIVLQAVVRMPRGSFREYAAGGGRVVVPVIALNAAYRAGTNVGRTSAAFLIGRGSPESEKLGPLRTDQGAREYRGLIARPLNAGVRR